jgi:hypothetical protein
MKKRFYFGMAESWTPPLCWLALELSGECGAAAIEAA